MKLVTYPLDGVTYSAEDVAAYLCTRTSGVYSRDSNFAVTVSGPREITVSPVSRGSTTTTSRASLSAPGSAAR